MPTHAVQTLALMVFVVGMPMTLFGQARQPTPTTRDVATAAAALAEAEAAVKLAEFAAKLAAAEASAAAAEARAAAAEASAAEAEARAVEAEANAAAAIEVAEELAAAAQAAVVEDPPAAASRAASEPAPPTEAQWQGAVNRATRYGRPERTSEGSLDDGSHYEQSADDKEYRASCDEDIMGFQLNIRRNAKSIHWRYLRNPSMWWRVYFNGEHVGELGDNIIRVADTETRWYEYQPARGRRDGEFVLLAACRPNATVDELVLELHYHH